MSEIEIEFAVQMHGKKCGDHVKAALDGFKIDVDTDNGRVTVHTTEPWSVVQDKIESTGRKAVLSGFGGQSAVAMISAKGSDVDHKISSIQGIIRFTSAIANDKAGCVVDGVVDGLSPGLHGLHVHETGDTSDGCASLGVHYNPRRSPHGGPTDNQNSRHAGDLGNIRADNDGRATFRFVDTMLEIGDIIGRSVAISEHPDDYGREKNERSKIDGNSGKSLACGIIARSAGILQNFKKICACDGVTLWDERNKPIAGGQRSSQKL